MRKNRTQRFPYFRNFTFNKDFIESKVFKKMKKIDIEVLMYYYGNITFVEVGKKNKTHFEHKNNGDIRISITEMSKNLKISRTTGSNSVHRLIEYGLLKITYFGGNNVCHIYKVLINANPFKNEQVCLKKEERWRRYSDIEGKEVDWKKECPKTPPNCRVGVDTRFKTKPLPKELNRQDNNQSKELNRYNAISTES